MTNTELAACSDADLAAEIDRRTREPTTDERLADAMRAAATAMNEAHALRRRVAELERELEAAVRWLIAPVGGEN